MDTLTILKTALKEECGIDPSTVNETTNVLKDLGIDSLDLLNAAYWIEARFDVKLPILVWIGQEYGDVTPSKSPFVVQELCDFLTNATPSKGG